MDAPPVDLAAERAAYLLRQELRYAEARARRVLSAAGLRPTRHTLLQAAAELYPQRSHTERMAMVEQAQQLHAVTYAPPATPTPEPALPAVAAPADPPSAPNAPMLDTTTPAPQPGRRGRPGSSDEELQSFIRERLTTAPQLSLNKLFDECRSGYQVGKMRFRALYHAVREELGIARAQPASKPAPATPAAEGELDQARREAGSMAAPTLAERRLDALAGTAAVIQTRVSLVVQTRLALTTPDGRRWSIESSPDAASLEIAERIAQGIVREYSRREAGHAA